MSYKKYSKSRLARFMLALTIIGGVGQRLADNKSYAATVTTYRGGMPTIKNDVYDIDYDSAGPLLQVVEFEEDLTTRPSKGQDYLRVEAQLFESIMRKGVTKVGDVSNEGKLVKRSNYNNDEVKGLLDNALKSVFMDAILARDNGNFMNLSTRDYISGVCGGDPWGIDISKKYDELRTSVTNSAQNAGQNEFFKTNVKVDDGGAGKKVTEMDAIKKELKEFVNGLLGSSINFSGNINSVCSHIRISKDGSSVSFGSGVGRSDKGYYYLYSSARLTSLKSKAYNNLGNVLSALIGKLGSYEDEAGSYLKVAGNYYKLGNGSLEEGYGGKRRPIAVFQAISEFASSGDLESACNKYNEAVAVGDRLSGILAGQSEADARARLGSDFDSFVKQGVIEQKYVSHKSDAVEMVLAFARIYNGEVTTRSTPNFSLFIEDMAKGNFSGFLDAIQAMYGIDPLGIRASNMSNPVAMECCFRFLSLKAGFVVPKGGDKEDKDKKSSKIKPILVSTGILASLGVVAFALHKTGYLKIAIDGAKKLLNKNKDRLGLQKNNNSSVGTNPAPGKISPAQKMPN